MPLFKDYITLQNSSTSCYIRSPQIMLGNLTEYVQYTLHMCQLSAIFLYCLCLFPYFLWLYIIGDDGQWAVKFYITVKKYLDLMGFHLLVYGCFKKTNIIIIQKMTKNILTYCSYLQFILNCKCGKVISNTAWSLSC